MSMIADIPEQAKYPKIMKPHSETSTTINCTVFTQGKVNGDAHKREELLGSSYSHDAIPSSPMDNFHSPFLFPQ